MISREEEFFVASTDERLAREGTTLRFEQEPQPEPNMVTFGQVRHLLGPIAAPLLIRHFYNSDKGYIDKEELGARENGDRIVQAFDRCIDRNNLPDWDRFREQTGLGPEDIPFNDDRVMSEYDELRLPPIVVQETYTTDMGGVIASTQALCEEFGLNTLTTEETSTPATTVIAAINRLLDVPLSFKVAREDLLLPHLPYDSHDKYMSQRRFENKPREQRTFRGHAKENVELDACGTYATSFIRLAKKYIPEIVACQSSNYYNNEHEFITIIVEGEQGPEEILVDPAFMQEANKQKTLWERELGANAEEPVRGLVYEPGVYVGRRENLPNAIHVLRTNFSQEDLETVILIRTRCEEFSVMDAEREVRKRYGASPLSVGVSDPHYELSFHKREYGPSTRPGIRGPLISEGPAIMYQRPDADNEEVSFSQLENLLTYARSVVEQTVNITFDT